MALFAWAGGNGGKKQIIQRILFPLAILSVSEIELSYQNIRVYPAALLLSIGYLIRSHHSIAWEEVTTAALIGAFICWKTADAWPLLPGILLLCGALLLVPIALLCHDREERFFAIALGTLFYEWFFCLKEYMLFSFCVVRIGSKDSLSLGTAAMCLYGLIEPIWQFAFAGRKHAISISN